MIEGFLTVGSIKLADGKIMTTQRAVELGWIIPASCKPAGWDFAKEEVPLGYNTMVDNGRQLLAFLFGGRTPSGSYTCSRFGIGTGTTASDVSFTDLEAPVNFFNDGISSTLLPTKPINGVDFPVPFVARVEFGLDTGEANGLLITEFGLYASDLGGAGNTLLARKTETGTQKNSDFAPTFIWRVRF
jgi:hypothetical protein